MNVYEKIRDYLGEANLPTGSKKINSRLAYVKDKQGNISVWEKSKKGQWSEWWLLTPEMFTKEFGVKVK